MTFIQPWYKIKTNLEVISFWGTVMVTIAATRWYEPFRASLTTLWSTSSTERALCSWDKVVMTSVTNNWGEVMWDFKSYWNKLNDLWVVILLGWSDVWYESWQSAVGLMSVAQWAIRTTNDNEWCAGQFDTQHAIPKTVVYMYLSFCCPGVVCKCVAGQMNAACS